MRNPCRQNKKGVGRREYVAGPRRSGRARRPAAHQRRRSWGARKVPGAAVAGGSPIKRGHPLAILLTRRRSSTGGQCPPQRGARRPCAMCVPLDQGSKSIVPLRQWGALRRCANKVCAAARRATARVWCAQRVSPSVVCKRCAGRRHFTPCRRRPPLPSWSPLPPAGRAAGAHKGQGSVSQRAS